MSVICVRYFHKYSFKSDLYGKDGKSKIPPFEINYIEIILKIKSMGGYKDGIKPPLKLNFPHCS